ncbi:MAG TPA: polysaccharide deacetylase family protein [Pyrinomonadaceae bacterium]
MLKKIKQVTLGSLKTAGISTLVQKSRWRRERLLILAYHGISLADEHEWDPSLYMKPSVFRSRMHLLKSSGCTVLPLGEAVERLYASDLPDRCVALTFDDGNYDFYEQAHPILQEFDLPVTLYLTTFYSHYNRPVFDVICSYLLWKGRDATLALKKITGREAELNLSRQEARAAALKEIHEFARRRELSAEEKDALAASLAKELKIDYDALLARRLLHLLKPDEAKRLAAGGVDIQLHTHRHRVPLDRELFRREIEDNRKSIREMTGTTASHFCYPSGVYDAAFLPWLDELEVVSATTCETGFATKASEPLLLPRLLDTSSLSPIEFESWLAGVSAVLPRRREPQKMAG